MKRVLAFAGFCVAMAYGQEPAKPLATGSISGVVREADTGRPLAKATVSISDCRSSSATTDAQGRYELKEVSPGECHVFARADGSAATASLPVSLQPGQAVSEIDFRVRLWSAVSGRVLDEDNDPVPGITVLLFTRAYYLGSVRSVYGGRQAQTDDRGQYIIRNVPPGRPLLLMAERRLQTIEAVSDAPTEPTLRKRAYARTFYPSSASIDGALPLVLRSGEQREGVDITILRTPSYCVDGVLTAQGVPSALRFSFEPLQPSSGVIGREGGGFVAPPSGVTGADGRIRVCDLAPAEYRLTAYLAAKPDAAPDTFGMTLVTVTDRDLHNVRLASQPRIPVPGEVVWDGAAPGAPVSTKLMVALVPLTRRLLGAESPQVQSSIPGEFSLPDVLMDAYAILTMPMGDLPAGSYIKDVTYAGVSVRNAPLQVGSGPGFASLRVMLARDGGKISAQLTDGDGKPVPRGYVLVLPGQALTEAALADLLILGQTNQLGVFLSDALAPGKYLALAVTAPLDQSPESIGKLWGSRGKATEVEVSPGATAQVQLRMVTIE